MAVLVAGLALALGTAGHDWYAAWKFTLVEAMLTAGFSDYGVVEYSAAFDQTISRDDALAIVWNVLATNHLRNAKDRLRVILWRGHRA